MSRFVLSLVLLAACAEAQTPRGTAAPGATQPTSGNAADTEPVCHEEAVTGSNMTRTVCRTKSQQEIDRSDAQSFSQKTSRQRQTIKGN